MLCELAHVQRKTCQVPFHAHQKKIAFSVLMLVGVQGVAVPAINKIVDRSVEAFLVGTTDEQDGGVLHRALRGMWALLMVTRNCFLPGFIAQRLSIFGQMAFEMIIEILCVAAQIEHDAPHQRAAG